MIILCAVATAATVQDCSRNTEVITVASEKADCMGVAPQKCLLIKRDGADSWEFWYSGIEGFDHQNGYEYVLKIRREEIANPAADQSSIKYVLVKEISRTRKTSEEMPESTYVNEFINDIIIQ